MQNLHYLFHHEYNEASNEILLGQAFDHGKTQFQFTQQSFVLQTQYPGLLVGLGYPHYGEVDEAIKLGFSLDYVSGLPVIPSSTVKGVLRSMMRKVEGKDDWAHDENDVFFDAWPITKGKLLALESITPHPEPLKNPIPLKLLKVKPGIAFLFQFRLTDGNLSAEDKLQKFKELLLLAGIGAKTNVGFGGLEADDLEPKDKYYWLEMN
jgi:CRISPR-associated protein Cmr6